jgi:glucose-1-phosphate thymidylyltransferase
VVELGDGERVVGLEEKPEHPKSSLVSTATYIFGRDHLPLMKGYLEAGLPPDPPGKFISWLLEREPLFGYGFAGEWLDIGDPVQLLTADNLYRARLGLAVREQYSL